jgi:hypothetical protein
MHNTKDKQCIRINNSSDKLVIGNTQLDSLTPTVDARIAKVIPWFQRFIFIIFIAKGRGKINLWNQGTKVTDQSYKPCQQRNQQRLWHRV